MMNISELQAKAGRLEQALQETRDLIAQATHDPAELADTRPALRDRLEIGHSVAALGEPRRRFVMALPGEVPVDRGEDQQVDLRIGPVAHDACPR